MSLGRYFCRHLVDSSTFSVAPSAFQFEALDILSLNLLEGLLTTYHLTSVLVLSTDIESAAKARALSQCIGAGAAAAVTL